MLKNIKLSNQKSNIYQFKIIRPGGNDTSIIFGEFNSQIERRLINNLIMDSYSNVEQVGFLSRNKLIMAGGEFCGNATRSSAFVLLKGKPGEIKLKVSGVKESLICGVRNNGQAYAQMPIYPNSNKIIPIQNCNNSSEFLVEMEGISHLITFDTSIIGGLSNDEIKKIAKDRIKELKLNKLPAAGVIFTKKSEESYEIIPVVYVRDIDTLFLETACGSGTMALGLVLANISNTSIDKVPIIQPSGMDIKVSVDFNGQKFKNAFIEGIIKSISSGKIYYNFLSNQSYVSQI